MPILNLSEKEYFSHPAINSSLLKLMVSHTPADFKHEQMFPSNETTRSMDFGSAIHCLLLEPEKFKSLYVPYEGIKRGKKWETFKNDHPEHIIISNSQLEQVINACNVVLANPTLRIILANSQKEISAVHKFEEGYELKAKADILGKKTMWDVKTTAMGLSDKALYRAIYKYYYHFSAAHYMKVFNANLEGRIENFGWIFIDTTSKLFHTRLVLAPADLLESGFILLNAALEKLQECMKTNVWEGYPQSISVLNYE